MTRDQRHLYICICTAQCCVMLHKLHCSLYKLHCSLATNWLTQGFRRHTWEYTRGAYHIPVQISAEGISRMPYKAMGKQFVAREQCNIMQHCAVYKKYTWPASALLTVRLLVLGIYQARKLSSYGFPGYKGTTVPMIILLCTLALAHCSNSIKKQHW